MTSRPSTWPKLPRKDMTLRDGIGLRHITLNTARPSNAARRRPSDLLQIMSSHAPRSARLLLPPASNSTTGIRSRALSP